MSFYAIKRYQLLVIILSAFFASSASALDMSSVCILSDEKRVCRHAPSGEKWVLQLSENNVQACDFVSARWFHETTGRELITDDVDSVSFCEAENEDTVLSLLVPKVQSPTAVRLEIAAEVQGETLELLSDAVMIYPPDQMKSLKEWSQRNVLVVKGESEALEDFLDQENIEWSGVNIPTPSELTEKIMIVVGRDAAENMAGDVLEMPTIFLLEEDNGLPLIRESAMQVSAHLKFTGQLSTSPYARAVFLDLIKTVLSQKQNTPS